MKKIIVVDLDGSLITINSFRYWLLCSFVFLLVSFRWLSLLKFIKFIVYRLRGISDRVKMKRDILSVTEALPAFFMSGFVWFLCLFLNRNVLAEMNQYDTSQYYVDLCTAAPVCYAKMIAQKLDFSHVFATASVFATDWKENIGSQKVVSLEEFYGENMDIDCVITDHHDDLPLLIRAKKRILVTPSRTTREKMAGLFAFETIE